MRQVTGPYDFGPYGDRTVILRFMWPRHKACPQHVTCNMFYKFDNCNIRKYFLIQLWKCNTYYGLPCMWPYINIIVKFRLEIWCLLPLLKYQLSWYLSIVWLPRGLTHHSWLKFFSMLIIHYWGILRSRWVRNSDPWAFWNF